jgi:hypothetical protein
LISLILCRQLLSLCGQVLCGRVLCGRMLCRQILRWDKGVQQRVDSGLLGQG